MSQPPPRESANSSTGASGARGRVSPVSLSLFPVCRGRCCPLSVHYISIYVSFSCTVSACLPIYTRACLPVLFSSPPSLSSHARSLSLSLSLVITRREITVKKQRACLWYSSGLVSRFLDRLSRSPALVGRRRRRRRRRNEGPAVVSATRAITGSSYLALSPRPPSSSLLTSLLGLAVTRGWLRKSPKLSLYMQTGGYYRGRMCSSCRV